MKWSVFVRHCCFQECEPLQCAMRKLTQRNSTSYVPDMCKHDNTEPSKTEGTSSGTRGGPPISLDGICQHDSRPAPDLCPRPEDPYKLRCWRRLKTNSQTSGSTRTPETEGTPQSRFRKAGFPARLAAWRGGSCKERKM